MREICATIESFLANLGRNSGRKDARAGRAASRANLAGSPARLQQAPVRVAHGVARFEDRHDLAASVASRPQPRPGRIRKSLVVMGDPASVRTSGSRTGVRHCPSTRIPLPSHAAAPACLATSGPPALRHPPRRASPDPRARPGSLPVTRDTPRNSVTTFSPQHRVVTGRRIKRFHHTAPGVPQGRNEVAEPRSGLMLWDAWHSGATCVDNMDTASAVTPAVPG